MGYKKILIAATNHENLGESGKKTGAWLSEITHFYKILRDAGYHIDIISPKGGNIPIDPKSKADNDPINKQLRGDAIFMHALQHSLHPSAVRPAEYAAIFYPGGHGPMWDIAVDKNIAEIAKTIYENGGYIAAVCHGSAGLLPIILSNGQRITSGKVVTGLSNVEEFLVRKTKWVPFLLENELKRVSKKYTKYFPGMVHIEASNRVITGQNPRSTQKVATTLARALKTSEK